MFFYVSIFNDLQSFILALWLNKQCSERFIPILMWWQNAKRILIRPMQFFVRIFSKCILIKWDCFHVIFPGFEEITCPFIFFSKLNVQKSFAGDMTAFQKILRNFFIWPSEFISILRPLILGQNIEVAANQEEREIIFCYTIALWTCKLQRLIIITFCLWQVAALFIEMSKLEKQDSLNIFVRACSAEYINSIAKIEDRSIFTVLGYMKKTKFCMYLSNKQWIAWLIDRCDCLGKWVCSFVISLLKSVNTPNTSQCCDKKLTITTFLRKRKNTFVDIQRIIQIIACFQDRSKF